MSKQTYLKIFSILLIIAGVMMIVSSALAFAGTSMFFTVAGLPAPEAAADLEVQESAAILGAFALVLGIVLIVVGLFDLVAGILGFRAANGNESCAKVAKVMGIISIVCTAAISIYTVVINLTISTIATALAAVGITIAFVCGIVQVQNEGKTLAE